MKYEVRTAFEHDICDRFDSLPRACKNVGEVVERLSANGEDGSYEIWDCLRPNHPKVVATFTTC